MSGGAKLDNNVSSGGGGGGGDDLRQHVSNYLFTLTKSFSGSDDKAPLVLHVTVNINPQSVAKSSLPSSKGDFAAPDGGGSTIAIRIYELSHGAGSLSLDREWCIKSSFIFSSGGGCGAEVVVSAAISPAYVPPSTLPSSSSSLSSSQLSSFAQCLNHRVNVCEYNDRHGVMAVAEDNGRVTTWKMSLNSDYKVTLTPMFTCVPSSKPRPITSVSILDSSKLLITMSQLASKLSDHGTGGFCAMEVTNGEVTWKGQKDESSMGCCYLNATEQKMNRADDADGASDGVNRHHHQTTRTIEPSICIVSGNGIRIYNSALDYYKYIDLKSFNSSSTSSYVGSTGSASEGDNAFFGVTQKYDEKTGTTDVCFWSKTTVVIYEWYKSGFLKEQEDSDPTTKAQRSGTSESSVKTGDGYSYRYKCMYKLSSGDDYSVKSVTAVDDFLVLHCCSSSVALQGSLSSSTTTGAAGGSSSSSANAVAPTGKLVFLELTNINNTQINKVVTSGASSSDRADGSSDRDRVTKGKLKVCKETYVNYQIVCVLGLSHHFASAAIYDPGPSGKGTSGGGTVAVRYFSTMQDCGLSISASGGGPSITIARSGCDLRVANREASMAGEERKSLRCDDGYAMEDMEAIMKERVKKGYGIDHDTNCAIIDGEREEVAASGGSNGRRHPDLIGDLWKFIQHLEVGGISDISDDALVDGSAVNGLKAYASASREMCMVLCSDSTVGTVFDDLCRGDLDAAIEKCDGNQSLKLSMMSYSTGKFKDIALAALSGTCDLESMCCLWHLLGRDDASYLHRILDEPRMKLRAKARYALKFLDTPELKRWSRSAYLGRLKEGDLEGLILCGMNEDGVKILERYIDRTSDLQTVACAVGRLTPGGIGGSRSNKTSEWVECYRSWLNACKLFRYRAKFDIARSAIIRGREGITRVGAGAAGQAAASTKAAEGGFGQQNGIKAYDEIVNVPRQVYVRCNYCDVSLPLSVLRRQEGRRGNATWLSQSSWLSREGPILKCCPSCRKPLPRCYVCLLSLGVLNPYLELKRVREKARGGGEGAAISGGGGGGLADCKVVPKEAAASLSSTTSPSGPKTPLTSTVEPSSVVGVVSSVSGGAGSSSRPPPPGVGGLSYVSTLPFQEFWTWCNKCNHGGHAQHIMDWHREKGPVCGVAGCGCLCGRGG